jgi:hypothetical protein
MKRSIFLVLWVVSTGGNLSAQSGGTVAAGNVVVIQNDALNNTTSVSVTAPLAINGFRVNPGSNRGDFNIGVDTTGTLDFANGVFITSVSQHGRDNSLAPNSGGNTDGANAGLRYSASAIDFNATSMFVPVHWAGGNPSQGTTDNGEFNANFAAAYFRYSDGWLGGHVRNPTNGASFLASASSLNSSIALATVTAPVSGSYILDGSTLTTPTLGIHTLNINSSTGNLASQNGILLVNGGRNEDNYALSRAQADGSFTIYGHDLGADGANYEQDGVAFVYIPSNTPGLTSGRVRQTSGTVANLVSGVGSDNAGTASISQLAAGRYLLTISGVTSSDAGVLIVSPEGGNGNNVDNIVTYEWSPADVGWTIESRDLPNLGLQTGTTGADVFSFAFVPVPEPLMVLGLSGIAVVSIRRRVIG